MKILFLDFDGVLNSKRWMATAGDVMPSSLLDHRNHVDMAAVARLERIVAATGAKVVISSTWRLIHPLSELKNILSKNGFTGDVIGMTPNSKGQRGNQIADWLNTNGPVESFVILDDSDDMVHLMHKLVLTTWEHGLQDEHVVSAIGFLNA